MAASSTTVLEDLEQLPAPIALLDVDDTLINRNGELNLELVNTLKNSGITQVWLLTDMTFTHSLIEGRQALIGTLANHGITCRGVITPLDLFWSKIKPEDAQKLEEDLYQNFSGSKYAGPEFRLFFKEALNRHPAIALAFYSDLQSFTPGVAFAEASQALSVEDRQANQIKGNICKVLADVTTENLMQTHGWLKHSKGFLVRQFLANKPGWVNGVVIADDLPEVISTMRAIKKNATVPMTPVQIGPAGQLLPDDNYLIRDERDRAFEEKPIAHSSLQEDLLQKITDYLSWRENKTQDDGRGYAPGFFTRLRHWSRFGENRARALHGSLNSATPEQVVGIIQEHFRDGHSSLHNHSLDAFLLEAIDGHLEEVGINRQITTGQGLNTVQTVFSLRNPESRAALREKVLEFDPDSTENQSVQVQII